MNTPTILQGNTFTLAIPLRVYILDDGGVVLEDYTPDEGDEVVITLKGPRRFYTYAPRIDGNVARIDIGGYELCGLYSVAVAITKDDGQKLRTYRDAQLSIVESIDAVTDSELEQGIEQGVLYLDAATFLSGADGRGIESVVKTATAGLVDTYTITYTDGTTSTFDVTNGRDGEDGADGVGIVSITKTATSGLVDTYTILLTNGNTTTFQVTNGKDGETPDMSDYYNKTETNTLLGGKQDTLVSGTNIKTINNTSILGSGNVALAPRPFVVSITGNGDNTYTADKTFAEILAAYNGGAAVYFIVDNVTAQAYLSLGAIFIAAYHYGNVLAEMVLTEDGVDVTSFTLLTEGSLKTINNESLEGSGNLLLATQAALNNYCPIIEDTRTSATDVITGNAPFSELVKGQRILLHLKFVSITYAKLRLYLSNGNATDDIRIFKQKGHYDLGVVTANELRPDGFYELVYDGLKWVVEGAEKDTTYSLLTQSEINSGGSTSPRVVSAKLIRDNFYLKNESDANYLPSLVEVAATGDVSQALDSGKFYRFGEVDSLTLTFTAPSAGMGMWAGKFTASASWTALGIPESVDEAAGNDTISAGKRYEFQLFDSVIVIKEV